MPLTLLPNLISASSDPRLLLPKGVETTVAILQGLFAESDKGGRSFLKNFKKHIPIVLLNEHTRANEIDFLLEPLVKGEHWGLISDSGLPIFADPGALLVKRAHELKIKVEGFSGPSSITLALMLSGLSGQQFTFYGYLAKEKNKRELELKKMESTGITQIFIERPYHNGHTLESCLAALHPNTLLCLAWDLTGPSEGVLTQEVAKWRETKVADLNQLPTVFIIKKSGRT